MARQKFTWTSKQFDKLIKVREVLQNLNEYKPLTLRQIFYQLVGAGHIENTVSEYTMLSTLLKWARIHGYVPWSDIEDRVRDYHSGRGWNDKRDFIKSEMSSLLRYYRRDLIQSQPKYIEVWVEKDALSSIFTKAAAPYCVSVVVCRGFSSISFLHDFEKRLKAYSADKEPVMLYFGDFDPSGVEMLDAMKTTLNQELGLSGIVFKRISLLRQDIYDYQLPHSPNALKTTDSRAKKHVERFGELAVELDALRPDVLHKKIQKAIEAELDMELFRQERDKYQVELNEIAEIKAQLKEHVDKLTG